MARSLLLCFLLTALPAMALDAKAQREIDQLLDFVARSGCQFVRNGSVHASPEASEHLRMKLSKAGNRIRSAEDFIEQLASQSYLSGKPYAARCPGKAEQPSKSWLSNELRRLRAA